ncbi:gamma-glutamylcyclotransferase [Pokkaliibacter sp. CJK22405]|uniref:gamma-glutamylcyclotransferase n=1 Tax=Pokkaliibacter sp. CJK22405 TaxID=3384615 RepID=UPI0039846416
MSEQKNSHVLSRLLMESGGVEAMIARDSPTHRILTEEERHASLREALAQKPAGETWVFGYGSLIWNPTIHHIDSQPVRIHGWHRSFCLSVTAGRGSPEQPGLVLALDEGGSCSGVAYQLEEANVWRELELLWRREMVSGAYIPRWLPMLSLTGEARGYGLAFTMDHGHEQYAGDLTEEELLYRIAYAGGALGSCAEYLFHTCEGLHQSGIADRDLDQLAQSVKAYQAQAIHR